MDEIDSFVRRKIIALVDAGKIKTVHADGILINKQNLEEHRLKILYKPLMLSRKYLDLFIQDNVVDHVYRRFIKDPKQHIVVSENKIFDFDLSMHAKKQFVRRLIYVITDDFLNFSVKPGVIKTFELNQEEWFNIVQMNAWDSALVIDTILDFIRNSSALQMKSISRGRDRREIEKRHNKHGITTNRLINHPFAFIIQDGVIKTVELYSSTVDVRTANAITSHNHRWREWFKNHCQSAS